MSPIATLTPLCGVVRNVAPSSSVPFDSPTIVSDGVKMAPVLSALLALAVAVYPPVTGETV